MASRIQICNPGLRNLAKKYLRIHNTGSCTAKCVKDRRRLIGTECWIIGEIFSPDIQFFSVKMEISNECNGFQMSWMRSSRCMRSSRVVKVSDCQCQNHNRPGFDPSIHRHSGIWGATVKELLNKVLKKTQCLVRLAAFPWL